MSARRQGVTTGACAAAAAKAAAMLLEESILLPVVTLRVDGEELSWRILSGEWHKHTGAVEVSVRKDAGSDPDVTDGATVCVRLEPLAGDPEGTLVFAAGEGVGTVTKPGLQIPVGEPAINPVPRGMIRDAVRGVTAAALRVVVSIPGGEALARRTMNGRLGIVGGLSILGTTGRVRPFSRESVRETVWCALRVARAGGHRHLALVPGHFGYRAARVYTKIPQDAVLEVGNEWGFVLERLAAEDRAERGDLTLVGHPRKLAKLAMGHWDTHSSRAPSAAGWVWELACGCVPELEGEAPATVEGVLSCLPPAGRGEVDRELSDRIAGAVRETWGLEVDVILITMQGTRLA